MLALTDRPSSPLAPLADVALYCQTETSYRPNCETSVLALIEALTSAVALRAPGAVQSAGRILQAVRPWLHGGNGPRTNGTNGTNGANGATPQVTLPADSTPKKKTSR